MSAQHLLAINQIIVGTDVPTQTNIAIPCAKVFLILILSHYSVAIHAPKFHIVLFFPARACFCLYLELKCRSNVLKQMSYASEKYTSVTPNANRFHNFPVM